MRLRHLIVLACVGATLLVAGPSQAIVGGSPDTEHGYVGILAFVTESGGLFACTGSLVDSDTVVTAAHCFPNGAEVQFYLDDSVTRQQLVDKDGYEAQGTFTRNPGFGALGGPDLAVVQLDGGLSGPYASLPPAGAADGLDKRTSMTVVGYGVAGFATGGGPPRAGGAGTRRSATAELVPSNDNLVLTLRLVGGTVSACSGDSGGPALIGDTIYATTSFTTNHMCAGRWEAYRLDTSVARAFLGSYTTLP